VRDSARTIAKVSVTISAVFSEAAWLSTIFQKTIAGRCTMGRLAPHRRGVYNRCFRAGRSPMCRKRRIAALLLCTGWLTPGGAADEDQQSRQRLTLMEQEIAQFAATSAQITSGPALRFTAKPVLRYSDPTRGLTAANVLMDATVWRFGEQGRPTALVTLEIYRSSSAQGVLSFEFLSLSPKPFALRHKSFPRIVWDATESALQLSPCPGSPEPAGNASARLLQMRQLSKRFAVREKLANGETVECRLLPQPIDRYQSADQQIVDGAIFAFANGTNPEIGLILECDTSRWSYAAVRLSAAETTVYLDDREAARFPLTDSALSTKGSYISHSRPLQLP
jgi:hypothetical protein